MQNARLQTQAGDGLENGRQHRQPVDGGQRDAVPLQAAGAANQQLLRDLALETVSRS